MIDDWTYHIHQGDCLDVMARMPDDSVDLIVTSPPYAQQRRATYGGVAENEYVEWWMARAAHMRKILKPTGSLVLNIKESRAGGIMQPYVYDMVVAMRGLYRLIDEFCWVKQNPYPGIGKETLTNGWERIFHFAGPGPIKFYRKSVLRQATEHHRRQYKMQNRQDKKSGSGSGLTDKSQYISDPERVEANNVIITPMHKSRKHPATFPDAIPTFFILLLTIEGDVVLDPFSGSGTTYRVAQKAGRKPIGIEIKPEYIQQPAPMLFDP